MFRLLSISYKISAVNRGAISAVYPTELDLGSCFKMMRTTSQIDSLSSVQAEF
jgi:hypothetical protein